MVRLRFCIVPVHHGHKERLARWKGVKEPDLPRRCRCGIVISSIFFLIPNFSQYYPDTSTSSVKIDQDTTNTLKDNTPSL